MKSGDDNIIRKLDEFHSIFQNPEKPKAKNNIYLPLNGAGVNRVPKKKKLDNIIRALDNEYIKQLKETEMKSRKGQSLYAEMDKYKKQLEMLKRKNRDEDLLKLQKENQEIEEKLRELKNTDKSELKQKEEEYNKLTEELNVLFNEKKKEALEKDEIRKNAIEEIKQTKKNQEELKKLNLEAKAKLAELEKERDIYNQQVDSFNNYKNFIEKVIEKMNDAQINDYEKLKEKFESLIERRDEIKKDIEDQEKIIEDIKNEKNDLVRKNNKQDQNKRLLELENETKEFIRKNKELEKEIENIVKKNQKKECETHQIELSINNLYNKVKDSKSDKDLDFCEKLNVINDKITDLINIYKRLEKVEKKS